MAASDCPKCKTASKFEIKPTFLPSETVFGRQEVNTTFSLNVQCTNCGETFKVIDHNNVNSIGYLLDKAKEFDQRIKTIEDKG